MDQFCHYHNASKLAAEAGKTQHDTLLYVMGEESEKIFENETLHFGTVAVGEGGGVREVPE